MIIRGQKRRLNPAISKAMEAIMAGLTVGLYLAMFEYLTR